MAAKAPQWAFGRNSWRNQQVPIIIHLICDVQDLSDYRILQMAPPIGHQVLAMMAILKRYNWNKFGVVTSNMAGAKEFRQECSEQAHNSDRTFKYVTFI